MTPHLQEGKKLMGQLERKDAEKRDAAAAKNDLEAYIISTGSTLEDESIQQVPHSRLACNSLT